jgi:hypothetical protein
MFLFVLFLILGASLFFVPNPVAKENLLGALIDKHERIQKITSPKIIFVGGSNLSFGLVSKMITDSLKYPVMNMGIHAGLGLKFMLDDTKPYVKEGDIIVLSPEYAHYYTDNFFGNFELAAVLFDVFPEGRKYVDYKQGWHLMNYVFLYSTMKMKYLLGISRDTNPVYKRESFNENGDAVSHYALPHENIKADEKAKDSDKVDPDVIAYLLDFRKYIESKKAKVLLFPPVYQQTSFLNQEKLIDKISLALDQAEFSFIAKPSRYCLPDSLFFNTAYHLTREGAEMRTALVLEDIKDQIIIKE